MEHFQLLAVTFALQFEGFQQSIELEDFFVFDQKFILEF